MEDILNRLEAAFAKVKKKPKPFEGLPESPTPFADTLRRAREGDPVSQYNLSTAYKKGDGVAQDSDAARYWLLQSADNGFPPALYDIGCYLMNLEDRQNALVWFMLAAKQNFGPAQFNVGILCGTAGDYLRAYVWLYLAEQNRVEKARENRQKAATFLSSEELTEARRGVSAMMMDFKNRVNKCQCLTGSCRSPGHRRVTKKSKLTSRSRKPQQSIGASKCTLISPTQMRRKE